MPFAEESGTFPVLRAVARGADAISITPDTVQQILAYAAEKEQALCDLKSRISELERLLETDELTGLLNRRGFEAAAHRVLASAARYGERGVLVLIDLDGFKHVNDRHGHAAGDAALKLVGRILSDHIRATDYAARLSGDEFAMLWLRALPAALHRRFGDLKRALNTSFLEWNGKKIALKASAGTATYDSKTTFNQLIQRADKAMYRSKRARRA
jgi:diguanylate cyclase (GGDEF)-like protein